ncbi:MAG: GAF domain-containing protein [Chloroflexi bacterium]|nr:GAF domain-containing protein [Chloroflexota bacterium]
MIPTIDTDDVLLNALMTNSPDFIFVKDRQSRFVSINKPQTELLLGLHDPKEVIGKTDFDLFPGKESDSQRFFEEEQRIMESGQPVIHREWMVPNIKTGRNIWVSESKFPLRDKSGQIIGLLGVSRDITALKEAELQRDKLTRELQAIIDVAAMVGAILDPQILTEKIVESVHERFGFHYVGLFIVSQRGSLTERAGEYAYLRAGSGVSGQELLKRNQKLKAGGNSVIGQCIQSGCPSHVPDIRNSGLQPSNPLLPEIRSEIALPLASRQGTIGALLIQSNHENFFTERDISLLTVLAGQLASALENAFLYQQIDVELEQMKIAMKSYVRSGWDSYLGKGSK